MRKVKMSRVKASEFVPLFWWMQLHLYDATITHLDGDDFITIIYPDKKGSDNEVNQK